MKLWLPYLACLIIYSACIPLDTTEKTGTSPKSSSHEPALFREIPASEAGIDFQNQVIPNDQLSISTYPYFYNGGGVAAGDFDNDGRIDLYFVANQGPNALFLNQGDFSFVDVTAKAGVAGTASWSTGVSIVDINADGWLDLYVLCMHGFRGATGQNELFINQGDGTFIESAGDYGLDIQSFGTHAAFFDYDHDGDLDCYLLNHAVHDANSQQSLAARGRINTLTGDQLMQNINGKFRNVTEAAGIIPSLNGYGLGVSVADFDRDGWEDIYVSNDFHEDDFYYHNQGDGTFREAFREYFGHASRYSMGSYAADFDNDGYLDLVTLDMAPPDESIAKSTVGEDPNLVYHYKRSFGYADQYNRNCLQWNREGLGFSEVGALAGITATDWSWTPILADFDLDGDKDLFVSNGIEKRPNDLDFLDYLFQNFRSQRQQGMQLGTADYVSELEKMPTGRYHNFYFSHRNRFVYEDQSLKHGFTQEDVLNGVLAVDLDSDGDLDLVGNRLNESPALFKNSIREQGLGRVLQIDLKGTDKNLHGIGSRVEVHYNGEVQVQYKVAAQGYLSSVEAPMIFGFNEHVSAVDSVLVHWTSGISQHLEKVPLGETVVFAENTAANQDLPRDEPGPYFTINKTIIPYAHIENNFIDFSRDALVPFCTSTEGPALAIGDLNGDDLDDIFVGGARGQSGKVFLQNRSGTFYEMVQKAMLADQTFEDVDAVLCDVDGDQDLDLYVASGGNEFNYQSDRLYLNVDGKGTLARVSSPVTSDNKSCVQAADYDGDGDIDLFIGVRNVIGAYGIPASSYLLLNDGSGKFSDGTNEWAPELDEVGMITDAAWNDYDLDGDIDLLTVGEWMAPVLWLNEEGRLKRNDVFPASAGLWQSLLVHDFDGDGDVDFVGGNLGLNTNLIKEKGATLKLYLKDFDHNNKVEQILTYSKDGQWFPALLKKDELGKVLPNIIQKRFIEHRDFAGKDITEIFTVQELEDVRINIIDELATCYFENQGDLSFAKRPMPAEVQISSVHAMALCDFNDDDMPDVILGGNKYQVHTFQGRYDASYGQVLVNNGSGDFKPVSPRHSGVFIPGQIRFIGAISIQGLTNYIVARNDAQVLLLSPMVINPS